MKKHLFTILFLGLTTACSSFPVGDWESKDRIAGGERISKLEVEANGEGKATLYLSGQNPQVQAVPFSVDYEIEWEEDDDEFEFEMKCRGNICRGNNFDFTMECEDDDGALECKGDGTWSGVDLDWELDE